VRRSPWLKIIVASVIILVGIMTACGNNNAKKQSPLIIASAGASTFERNFNYFTATTKLGGTFGLMYEPLLAINTVDPTIIKGWLADKYEWNADFTKLTFTLHKGVKWSDGQAFTSADVVYTFNDLIMKYPAMDTGGIAKFMASVTASDDSTVVITFKSSSLLQLYTIGGQTPIVPQHLWSKYADPSKDTNQNPVGTGPYTLSSFTPQVYTFKARSDYWNGNVPIKTVKFAAYADNTTAGLALEKGDVDWASISYANINRYAQQPNHYYYWPPANASMYYVNLTKPPFNDVAFRKALSAALDRQQILQIAQGAVMPNPTGLLLPMYSKWLAPKYKDATYGTDAYPSGNVAAAKKILDDAGYQKNASGKYLIKGTNTPISFKISVMKDWTETITMAQSMAQSFGDVSMTVTVDPISQFDGWWTPFQTGTFDSMFLWTNGGATPYSPYFWIFDKSTSAAVGSVANNNDERYPNTDPDVSALLDQFAMTTDLATQQSIMEKVEDVMVNQVPVIPFDTSTSFYEYSTEHFTGWPTKDNFYENGSNVGAPDGARILLKLQPR
jgi:peptide/nickel transport system substrate-binding protein